MKHTRINEEIPQNWKDENIVPIFKKDSRRDCGNYREISLFSVAGKILARVILNRVEKDICNKLLSEAQCGFRNNRSTIDMIFSLRKYKKMHGAEHGTLRCVLRLHESLWYSVKRRTVVCAGKVWLRALHDGMQAKVVQGKHTSLKFYLPAFISDILTWGSACESITKTLQVIQNKIFRIISKVTYKSAVTNNSLFHSQNILKIRDIYNLELAKLMYKYHIQMLPITFEKYFNSTAATHCYETRNAFKKNYFLPQIRTKVKIICNLLVFKYGILYSLNGRISASAGSNVKSKKC